MKFALVLSIVVVSLATTSGFAQSVIFNDDFSTAPSANGWTEATVGTNTAAGTISSTPTAALLDKTSGVGSLAHTFTRTVSTLGFESVAINLRAFQAGTSFEGGAYRDLNVDSISVFIDTGSGLTPLFRRTGVWGAPTAVGDSDGGNGFGNTVPTDSGFLLLGAAADNNGNLQIQIEGLQTANAEDIFIDDFTVQGIAIAVAELSTAPVNITIIDAPAIDSFFNSAVPFVSALDDVNLGSVRATSRDLNERLFRLRTGLSNEGASREVQALGTTGATILTEASDWTWFATGDYGSTNQNPLASTAGFESDTVSSSVGVELATGASWAAGLAWSYLDSSIDFGSGLGDADVTGHTVSIYGTLLPTENCWLSALYSYSDLQNDLRRSTGLGSIARANPDGGAHRVSVDGGYHLEFGPEDSKIVTGPYLGLDYISGEIDAYAETGSFRGGVTVEDQNYESLIARVGWQISKHGSVGDTPVIPQIRAAWEREYEGADDATRLSLSRSPTTVVNAGEISSGDRFGALTNQGQVGRDYLSLGTGVKLLFNERCSLTVDYEGQFFRGGYDAHFAGVRCRLGF